MKIFAFHIKKNYTFAKIKLTIIKTDNTMKFNKIQRKMTKNFFYVTAAVVLLTAISTSCKKEVTGVTLNKTTLTLVKGGTEKLIATVTPDNATDKKVTWSSDNSEVATVSTDGTVTAKSAGKATITVTTNDGNKTATCAVTVTSSGIIITHPAEPETVLVEGGTFTMGVSKEQDSESGNDERPPHEVTLSSFHIGKYEVTQGQWKAIMGNNPSGCFPKGDNYPVENVNWADIQTFIKRLNDSTGKQYRLPTEAEWEYAARGGNQSKKYKYSGSNSVNEVAWHSSNSGSTRPVGGKLPNELGIYDMSGNVSEWCNDWYDKDYYANSPSTNPQGPQTATPNRVIRGGSWETPTIHARITARSGQIPTINTTSVGFRLVHP